MSKIQCSLCHLKFSTKRFQACPWCGNPAANQPVERAEVRTFIAGLTRKEWAAVAVLSLTAISLISVGYDRAAPEMPNLHRERIGAALEVCQRRVEQLAEHGARGGVPAAKSYGSEVEFYFVWPKGSLYFNDLDGDPVAMSATCRGVVSSGQITEISINGKQMK